MPETTTRRNWRLHASLLALWFVFSFGVTFFARDLPGNFFSWPIAYWFAAQGSLLIFIGIVVAFAIIANRRSAEAFLFDATEYGQYTTSLHKRFATFVVGLLFFLVALALAEQWGLPKAWVAGIFLSVTLVLYAVIGVFARTADANEYYVAGRRIPGVYNGMATAADWMSAASFISLAGGLYSQGFSGSGTQPGGLAYVLGWTGGFCLVALLVAPYLRSMNIYTVPDFFRVRFGGHWPRRIAAWSAVLCSFTYVVAQLYGVGLITSRLTGVHFEIGILLALGGVLVCSFLGGMRAVTWTQVTQYVVIILAFLIPVSWLSYQQTGNPFAPFAYGQQLVKITDLEASFAVSPQEQEVIAIYARRVEEFRRKLLDVEASLAEEREELRRQLRILGDSKAPDALVQATRKSLAALPKDAVAARELWTRGLAENTERARALGGMAPQTRAFAGNPDGNADEQAEFNTSRANFLALMFCLMVGTAGLPHLLTRFYTTPGVIQTRRSVAWSLVFIALLYLSAPALAVLVKYEVMAHLVGQSFDALPGWMLQWSKDPNLLSFSDVNSDGVLQFAELRLGADLIMLASPDIGGLPYVVSVLVAAGGLAAALSTADGLLLTIGNALAHDVYFEGNSNKAEAMRRVMLSKFALLVVALMAAYAAAQRPAGILYLVSASFSLAGAAFVPAMVLGIFWKRMTRSGAVAGMLAGLGTTVVYMVLNFPVLRQWFGLSGEHLWFGIQPVSAGVFGVPVGVLVAVVVSLLSSPDSPDDRDLAPPLG
ncbi:VC_2705 family sodium/solute symporter [Rhodoferax mekongensis]|uniref:VC_2705 family sodium/solute symporter n=1 Tax=Rhodoferax mekongensis TaxID=3068341 RepID=UPI0028BEB2B8|nr:VC_2705 family sodium/solute symporter [Rhodoferax sp. TBRC 17199]MDT7515281.1 VC_2705 family sodium/solute symporter [Rhodoferax sp. TBRC 17199]